MPLVAKSGATSFRQPLPPTVNNDGVVRKAAEFGITIHAEVSADYSNDPGLPSGSNRTDFLNKLYLEVQRYGYNGKFWDEPQNASLPKKHITTWEVWNEPNLHNIGAVEYGQFLNEAANTIQAASQSMAGRNTEVLSGGLLVWGNVGTGPVGYYGALSYLQSAYSVFGANGNVTGVAIHPYDLDPNTFRDPDGSGPQPRYDRIGAFKYAVAEFHAKLVELAKGGPQKSLWITETGWPAGGPEYPVTEADQASALRQVVDYLRNNESSLNVKALHWYNFRDAPGSSSWDSFCGLRAADGHFRQSWSAFQDKAGVGYSIPQAPGVEARPATNLEETKAKLNGWVHPQGLPTTYYFDYGTTTAFGNSTAPASVGEGSIGVWVDATLTNLQPDTKYYYRVVAANAVGVSISGVSSFKTPKETVAFSSYGPGELWTWSRTTGGVNTKLGVAPKTSPSIAALENGGTKIAFSSYGPNKLFTYGPGSTFQEYPYWLEPKSSPSITALAGGGWAIAFVGLGNHHLWVMTNSGVVDTGLGVEAESSPSITALPGGSYVVAFTAYGNRELWTYSPSAGGTPRGYYVTPYSSPDITAVGTSYVVAFNGLGSGTLWTWAPGYGGYDHNQLVEPYTSPSIAATLNGFTVGFSAYGTWNFTVMRSEGGNATVTNSGLSISPYSSPDLATIYSANYTSAFSAHGTNMLWTLTPFVGAFNRGFGVATYTTPSIAYG
jgi:hypothetical protein